MRGLRPTYPFSCGCVGVTSPRAGETKRITPMNDATQTGPQNGAYRVLARKYRPKTFDDLIGQDAMVRTISNAFEAGRIPQA